MNPRTTLRVIFAAACAMTVLGAGPAMATVYFVDGGCVTSGSGMTLGCGPSGPFQTIAEGILALNAGDTLNIRGAHGAFDGIYFESLALRDGAAIPGQALACTTDQRCVIQGCRAPACPSDEQPTIRGMTRRGDWVAQGGGVYARTMEASPNPDHLERDAYDPHLLLQGSAAPLTLLAYAGDSVVPSDGTWSYHPATHEVFVNPVGTADPATSVYVPHYAYHVHIQSPTAYVTLQYLTFEGTRGRSIEVESLPPDRAAGVILSHLTQRYAPRYFTIATRSAPGLIIEDSLAEYGCRGFSWAQPTNDGCMGYRLFGITGGIVRRNVVRHLGGTGRRRLSGPNAWPCPWCDAPWNDPNHTDVSAYGLAIQIKQTDTATVEDNITEDVSTGGIGLDVSRRVTVQRNTISRCATGVSLRNFTPTSGCPTTATTEFCYNSDHVIRGNVIDDVGFGDVTSCGITVTSGSERHVGATMLAEISNNAISRVGFGGICLENYGSTPTADLSIAQNTVYGARAVAGAHPAAGIVIADATQNVALRNNAFDGLTSDGLVVTTAGAAGLTMDGDVLGTVAGCQVRWNVPAFSGTPSGGSCDSLATHETHERIGSLQFSNVASVPPDLHLTAGSVAIDAGVALTTVPTDIDGDARPQGAARDAGADEFTSRVATTTTISGGSTTTTLPAVDRCLSGAKLILQERPRRLSVRSYDAAALVLGDGTNPRALIAQGGSLRVAAVGGDGFDVTYPLPARNWQLLDAGNPGSGVTYRGKGGAIGSVVFKSQRLLLVKGFGSRLEQRLGSEPDSVQVDLRIGEYRYRLEFAGQVQQFNARKRLCRKRAPRPPMCVAAT